VPIAAERGESVPLTFSEGSSVVVRPGGRVRVLGAEARGAHVLLEGGGIDVAITHRDSRGTAWTFDAGPLSVAVKGTRFHLAWSPREQFFTLGVSEGAVVVSGSCLSGARTLRAHERLEVACGQDGNPTPASAALPAAQPHAPTSGAGQAALAQVPSAVPAPSAAPSERGWRELLRAGEHGEALKAAERADFKQVCQSATQGELLGLSDAARISGDLDKSTHALVTLRQRFPGSPNAATAAFSLGRIAFERRAAYAEAVRWFSTYLNEAPNGPLMGDAVGRLMEARYRQGDRAAARADAERYLHRFPKGPYASVAKRLLTER
jgi:transmembrane sensor